MRTDGNFAIVQKGTDKNGNKVITAKVTTDIVLKKGQVVFFNDYEESIQALVTNKVITSEDANEQLLKTRQFDSQYGRETVYKLRAGNVPTETKESSL